MNSRKVTLPNDTSPFLLQFGEAMPALAPLEARYDLDRQLTQVRISGLWLDSQAESTSEAQAQTLITCVQRETTDDA